MWVKLDDTTDDDPRVVTVGLKAFGLLITLVCWNNRVLADGRIPAVIVRQKTAGEDDASTLIERLLTAGLLQRDGADHFLLPDDLLRNQKSRDQVERMRQERAEAGRIGGLQSGKTRRRKQTRTKRQANREAVASDLVEANTNPVPSRPVPDDPLNGRSSRVHQHPRIAIAGFSSTKAVAESMTDAELRERIDRIGQGGTRQ